MIIHVPFAVNTFWAFHTWRGMFLYFIVYLSVASFVDSYQKIEKFIDWWIIINLVCAIVGIMNGGKVPSSTFMGDENDFALVMAMAIPFAYFMFLQADAARKRVLYLTAVGVFVAANVASLSRGGFIALSAVGLFCWFLSPKKILSSLVVGIMVGILYLSAPPTYWDEVRSIKDENIEDGTGEVRWYSWKCGWRMFLDHPVIGVGQGNFPWNFEKYEPPGGLAGKYHGGRAAHSMYFTLIPELGLAGIILFFLMLYSSMRGMQAVLKERGHRLAKLKNECAPNAANELRRLRCVILGVTGAMVGYLVSGIFLSVLYYPHFWLLMAFAVAVGNVGKGVSDAR